MKLFRRTDPLALPVSMVGVKLGDRVLFAGCSDAMLIAALAVKTGLTGRAVAVDEQEARTRSAAVIAQREGALIETVTAPWTALPLEEQSFDVAVVRDILAGLTGDRRSACVREVSRVLRKGGRCVVIEHTARSGFGALFGRRKVEEHYAAGGGAVAALQAEGFKGVRVIAEREGFAFVEGVRPQP